MTSDSLQKLRSLTKEHIKVYQSYKSKLSHINETFKPTPERDQMIHALIEQHRTQLKSLHSRRESAIADIQERAAQRAVAGTLEGRAKVADALANGFDLHTLSQQLISEGDRVGLASLKAYIPYAAKRGLVLGGDDPRAIQDAHEMVDRYESQLWDAKEIAAQAERREAIISSPLMAENEKRLNALLDRGKMSQAHKEEIRDLFLWQGLPESNSPKGLLNPNESAEE